MQIFISMFDDQKATKIKLRPHYQMKMISWLCEQLKADLYRVQCLLLRIIANQDFRLWHKLKSNPIFSKFIWIRCPESYLLYRRKCVQHCFSQCYLMLINGEFTVLSQSKINISKSCHMNMNLNKNVNPYIKQLLRNEFSNTWK